MNYADLGEKVKAKYSEYKDVDSAELGQRVAEKYPEYQALITEDTAKPTSPQEQPQPQQTPNAGDIASSLGAAVDPRALMASGNQVTPFSQNPAVNAVVNSASGKLQNMAVNSPAVKTGLAAYNNTPTTIPTNDTPQGAFQKFTAPIYNAAANVNNALAPSLTPNALLKAGVSSISDPRQLALMAAGSDTVNNTAGKALEDFTSNVKAPGLVTDLSKGLAATDPKNIANFHKQTMGALDEAFQNEGKKFDTFIQRASADPKTDSVDLTSAIQDIAENKDTFSRLNSIVKKIPELKNLVSDLENGPSTDLVSAIESKGQKPFTMSLADSQNLYKQIGSKISASKLAGNNLNFEDYSILKYLRNSIRQAQIEALPEDLTKDFAQVRAKYGQAATDYKLLRKQLADPVTFEKNIKSNLGGSDILKQKAKNFSPGIAGDIENAARASKIRAGVKSVGRGAIGLGASAVGADALYNTYKHFNP